MAWPSSSTTAVMAMPFLVISKRASYKSVSAVTTGTSFPARMTSDTSVSNLRPSAPPGCERAKSSSRNPRASRTATASASPSASVVVVLAVGARFSGHASFSTWTFRWTSASCARLDSGRPVIAISFVPIRLMIGAIDISSLASPE